MSKQAFTTARRIADALGRVAIAETVGVSLSSVSEAVRAGRFPASWFLRVREMAAARDVLISETAFTFKQGDAA